MFHMITAMAGFERELIRERVIAGIANAKAKGRRMGRPRVRLDASKVASLRSQGGSWSEVCRELAKRPLVGPSRLFLRLPALRIFQRFGLCLQSAQACDLSLDVQQKLRSLMGERQQGTDTRKQNNVASYRRRSDAGVILLQAWWRSNAGVILCQTCSPSLQVYSLTLESSEGKRHIQPIQDNRGI